MYQTLLECFPITWYSNERKNSKIIILTVLMDAFFCSYNFSTYFLPHLANASYWVLNTPATGSTLRNGLSCPSYAVPTSEVPCWREKSAKTEEEEGDGATRLDDDGC